MSRYKFHQDERQEWLFTLPESQQFGQPSIKVEPIHNPIWTKHKARLIERYLYFFVFITRHGTYIDAFAGPQEPDKPEMWAAKLVLESEPKWLRHFYLFERKKARVKQLEELRSVFDCVYGRPSESIREWHSQSLMTCVHESFVFMKLMPITLKKRSPKSSP